MNYKGFTLIELVMILVLVGIIAAVVTPRLGDVTTTNASAFADKLRADIRYAQNLAMTTSQRHRVYINTAPGPAPGYAVVNVATGLAVQDPAGGNLSIVLNAGDYAGITVWPNAVIEFNSLGSPTGGTALTVSPGGATVTVTAETGAVN
jgi:type II secretory pathway pseudopilin PulG